MKPTADWEIVLERAKSAEHRARRMEAEARRLMVELRDYKEWAHAIAVRVLACGSARPEVGNEVWAALKGLMLHREDLSAVRCMNCEHSWAQTVGGLVVSLTCATCGLVIALDQAQLTELAYERLERDARVVVTSDVTAAVAEPVAGLVPPDSGPVIGTCTSCVLTGANPNPDCPRCEDRQSRGVIVSPRVAQGVYVNVGGRRLFHPDGLKIDWEYPIRRMADDSANVSWFGQHVGQVRMSNGVWYGIDANEENAPDQNSMLEAAARIVCSFYAVKLTAEYLRVGGLPFATVFPTHSDAWQFKLEATTTHHTGYLTRDDACLAAFSQYTELNQTREALGT